MPYQDTVVEIQFHHVGNGAQRHQVEQWRKVRYLQSLRGKPVRIPKLGPDRQQQVKHDADTRDTLAGEPIARLIWVDYNAGSRKLLAGQVMIGNQHVHPGVTGKVDACQTGDTVIHGHQEVRFRLQGQAGHIGTQTIPVFYPVRHQVDDLLCAQQAQPAQGYGAGSSAVRIIIGND